MFFVGEPKIIARRLVEVTYESMMRGIEVVKPGATLGDIGHAIQSFAEKQRFSVVTDFCGHGLGQVFRSEEHTSELQSLMRISYAVFCLKKKTKIYLEYDVLS